MNAVPIHAAAQELGVSIPTLRRWMREGCPVARRGHRGRGCATLLDPVAVESWRRAQGGEDALLAFAGAVPELVAEAVTRSFLATDGPHKRAMAGVLAGCWYVTTTAILDRLREHAPDVPEVDHVPESITRLRKIARQ